MRKLICLTIGYLLLAASAHGETVGVVMMHGKHGTPAQLQQLAQTITDGLFGRATGNVLVGRANL